MIMDEVLNIEALEGLKLIESSSVDLILTDPPYEVNYNLKSKRLTNLGKAHDNQIVRDASFVDIVPDYNVLASEWFRVLKDNSHVYIFCGDKQLVKWIPIMTSAGFNNYQILIWKKEKTTFDLSFGHRFLENKEFILFFHKGWRRLNGFDVERSRFRAVLEFKESQDTCFHSCAKPISLLKFLTSLSSNEGDVCLDCFAGSGNHLLAFKGLNRHFIGFELSKEYHQIILDRLKQHKMEDWFK